MALSFQSNLTGLAYKFFQLTGIPVSKTTLKKELEEHPYYPSLYSLNQVFSRFGVENEAFEVDADKFADFEPPFFAYYTEEDSGKFFVLVTQANGNTVTYMPDGGKTVTINRDEFIKNFQHVIFAAEKHPESGEKEYTASIKAEQAQRNKQYIKYTALAFLAALLFGQFFYSLGSFSWTAFVISLAKLAGIAVTALLLGYEIGDKSNSFVKNICSSGRQFNCDAVINSRASRILGFSWGEVGFFYFSSTCLFLLFPGMAFAEKLPFLAGASLLAAPYIIFSVYYQWRIVKQWCPLCLMVQGVLAIECIWSVFYFTSPGGITLTTPVVVIAALIAIALFIPLTAWQMLKPMLEKARTSTIYRQAYARLQHHPDVIKSLIGQQDAAPGGWENIGITLGNASAPNTIIKVCNPYCGPCARAHAVMEELVNHNKEVKVKIIFTTTNSEHDRGAPVVRHLLAIQEKGREDDLENALDDWYLAEKKNYESFSAKYPMNGTLQTQDEKIEEMSSWCKKAGIHYTPTIYVNGRRLPEDYDATILKNIF